jgi:GH24 family phage-related lysozyme (muramidase)
MGSGSLIVIPIYCQTAMVQAVVAVLVVRVRVQEATQVEVRAVGIQRPAPDQPQAQRRHQRRRPHLRVMSVFDGYQQRTAKIMKIKVSTDKSKAIHVIAMIFLMVVSLAGCDSGSNQSPPDQPPSQPGQGGAIPNQPDSGSPAPDQTGSGVLSKSPCPHVCLLIPSGQTASEIILKFEKTNNCSVQGGKNPNQTLHSEMKLSAKAINLLKSIEQLKLKPYDDQTGLTTNKWVQGATMGYGHLIKKNDWNLYKNGITSAQSDQIVDNDLTPFVKAVNDVIKVTMSQQQFDAMVILSYNIGISAFTNSSVVKLVNSPNDKTPYSNLEDAWKSWNKSQGKINQGLINSRNAEWNMYKKGIYKKW